METVVWLSCLPIETADLRMNKPVAGLVGMALSFALGGRGGGRRLAVVVIRKAVFVALPEKMAEERRLLGFGDPNVGRGVRKIDGGGEGVARVWRSQRRQRTSNNTRLGGPH